jgi:hypothetical protein
MMQHRDYQTTQRHINLARQLQPAVQNLYVPDLTPSRDCGRAIGPLRDIGGTGKNDRASSHHGLAATR